MVRGGMKLLGLSMTRCAARQSTDMLNGSSAKNSFSNLGTAWASTASCLRTVESLREAQRKLPSHLACRSFMRLPTASQVSIVQNNIEAKHSSLQKLNVRNMSSSSSDEVMVYKSLSEGFVKSVSLASIAQMTVCASTAALISFHPLAAQSTVMPGWTLEHRMALGGLICAFGGFFVAGCKGFLSKQILRVATLPSDPVEAEGKGKAFILPVFVGGSVMSTLVIDVRGELLDKEVMQELLTKAAQDMAKKGNWTEEEKKQPFIPNRHRNKL